MSMRKLGTATAVIMTLAFGLSAAVVKANFGGTWALDKSRSEGLPPNIDQTLTVTQDGDTIKLETKVTGGEQGEQVVPDGYTLDGKEKEFTPRRIGELTGKGKRTAKWTADGNGIEVAEQATYDTPEGAVTLETTRRWRLAADGKVLVIEMTVKSPEGTQQIKRTFVKK